MQQPSFEHDPFVTFAGAVSAAPSRSLVAEPAPAARAARVLVVEGEALLSESLSQVLATDFAVTAVSTATEALDRLASGETYDVVLCDLATSPTDVMELLRRVRGFAPELADRFLFVTSGDVAGERAETPEESLIDIRALRGVADWHFSHAIG